VKRSTSYKLQHNAFSLDVHIFNTFFLTKKGHFSNKNQLKHHTVNELWC